MLDVHIIVGDIYYLGDWSVLFLVKRELAI